MDYKVALNKTMAMCSRSEYCAFDILQKLEKWNVDKKDHKKVLDTLYQEKFIDDNRFVEAYVKDKFRFNNWGKVKISYMLRQKGFASDIINNTLDIIDDADYAELLFNEIKKKISKTKEPDVFKLKAKVVRAMASKGFEQDLIFKALNKIGMD